MSHGSHGELEGVFGQAEITAASETVILFEVAVDLFDDVPILAEGRASFVFRIGRPFVLVFTSFRHRLRQGESRHDSRVFLKDIDPHRATVPLVGRKDADTLTLIVGQDAVQENVAPVDVRRVSWRRVKSGNDVVVRLGDEVRLVSEEVFRNGDARSVRGCLHLIPFAPPGRIGIARRLWIIRLFLVHIGEGVGRIERRDHAALDAAPLGLVKQGAEEVKEEGVSLLQKNGFAETAQRSVIWRAFIDRQAEEVLHEEMVRRLSFRFPIRQVEQEGYEQHFQHEHGWIPRTTSGFVRSDVEQGFRERMPVKHIFQLYQEMIRVDQTFVHVDAQVRIGQFHDVHIGCFLAHYSRILPFFMVSKQWKSLGVLQRSPTGC
ncbi:MAG: hypothetical protein UY77_C0015G0003 [Candidatus Uhrbacteria bacterium GW2011_GWA2_53_10]|uniref:Uncharacterized protein n=1 Tax=Candidatus Uhrbacteria bacterium GW2011_GWA2_53_10 TaxID=1618980 RepID=A0A0G1XN86_9BACT|nr:MAG: hypothetical protein UY77_C0015G0003 [Candidatus Uhrbacteria bacterium GW2011_GWA2_53_10]